jgi:radical SAM superfamily enzyme YgiQ (UPF0313 family)
MSWKLKQDLESTVKKESGSVVREWGGKASVALTCPSVYDVGMGNLAVHSLYSIFNARSNIVCERAFLPSARTMTEHQRLNAPLMSMETQRPLAEFDVIAFTVSFENDYLNILPMLDLARIKHLSSDRNKHDPILIAGGAALTLNPEPVAEIFDAIVIGEIEEISDSICDLISSGKSRDDLIDALGKLPGVYIPSSMNSSDGVEHIFTKDLNAWKTETVIRADAAQFGDMHLIEVQRGCPRRCKFCATPPLYKPPRWRSADAVMDMVEEGLLHKKRFGLIGADILSYPPFKTIAQNILDRDATFSVSSARVDALDKERIQLLVEGGIKSIALGIEAGSEKLRCEISKEIDDGDIMNAAKLLAENGVTRIRPYFIIGLPGETSEDIESIIDISKKLRDLIRKSAPKSARTTSVDLTISSFVPKPGTPLEAAPFAGEAELKRKMKSLKRMVGKDDGINLRFDSALHASIEALLTRGGRDTIEFLEEANRTGNVRAALSKAIHKN